LRETLEKWLSDVALLSVARARARRQAERFDIRTLADQLWDEYRQLIPREIAADSLVGATV
jgi:glycosyltransferase involved in cell wall biosynthesis